jgi:hypothetical protein
MPISPPRALALLASAAMMNASARPATALRREAAAVTFEKYVRPVLAARCFKCHGGEKREAGVDLTLTPDPKSPSRQSRLWRAVARQVDSRAMPPEGQPRLTDVERQRLLRWLGRAIGTPDGAGRDPGPSRLRRLSRAEYDRTVRDLLGVPFDAGAAVGMPEESVGRGFSNQADVLTLPPALAEKYLAAADRLLDRIFAERPDAASRAALDALLVARPAPDMPAREAARAVLKRFTRRAYRRAVTDAEIERLLKLFDRVSARGGSYEEGVRLALKAVLVSPHFLFHAEQDRAPRSSREAYPVRDHELAARLSYFLWASMPDEELSRLADEHRLSDPVTFDRQVKRMLADPKARALAEVFAAEWLQLGKLAGARPDAEFFPTFTPALREGMAAETITFFDRLRAEDGSVLDLLDADYAYLNEELARHYGIAGAEGPRLRKVALKPTDHRGGLLGMGSVLAMTSHTWRTSPTLRGKWVLEVIFGTPPPPPPPDAAKIDDATARGKDPATFRELLARHSSRPACAGCHGKIDPLGFGLENYDAVGRWRDDGPGLDASGRLPTGQTFRGPGELKRIIYQRRGEFVRNLAGQLLSYALGRELRYYDEGVVREIVAESEKRECRFSALVAGVVKSYPFSHRRDSDAAAEDR